MNLELSLKLKSNFIAKTFNVAIIDFFILHLLLKFANYFILFNYYWLQDLVTHHSIYFISKYYQIHALSLLFQNFRFLYFPFNLSSKSPIYYLEVKYLEFILINLVVQITVELIIGIKQFISTVEQHTLVLEEWQVTKLFHSQKK